MEQILLEVNMEAKTGPVQTRVSLPWNIKLQLKKKKELPMGPVLTHTKKKKLIIRLQFWLNLQ